MLLRDRGLNEEQVAGQTEVNLATLGAFRSDDRLVKTLLLAALAPEVEALRELTARRLAALNHGTIISAIPGQEVGEVVRRLRSWASRVAELQVGEGSDPSVRLDLVGVNVAAILNRVVGADNAPDRRRLVRDLLFEELGVKDTGALPVEHPVTWRGSRRVLEIVYGNVRDTQDLRDDVFEPSQGNRWRLLIDFPFDAETYSGAEDRTRVLRLREKLGQPNSLAWLPAFFTTDVQDKLGRLLRVNHLLGGNRLQENAGNLGPEDRQRAKDLLTNLRGSLRSDLREALRNAYGLVARPREDMVQDWHDHLISLDASVNPRLDAGRNFADALRSIVDQLYTATFPDHPDFDPQRKGEVVRDVDLRTTLSLVRQAADATEGRIEVDRQHREALRRIAHPLRLGEEHNGPFVLGRYWADELERRAAQSDPPVVDIPIRLLRGWLSQYGMERRVENLVLATFAELTHRAWVRGGRIVDPPDTPDGVADDMELHRQALPSPADWDVACARASALTGADLRAGVISPRSVARFTRVLTAKTEPARMPAVDLVEVLVEYAQRLGLDLGAAQGRYHTAVTASELLIELHQIDNPTKLVEALAHADLGDVPPVVLSKSLETSRMVIDTLRTADWQVLERLSDPRAASVRETLRTDANANEQAVSLRVALDAAKRELLRVVLGPPLRDPPPANGPTEVSKDEPANGTKTGLSEGTTRGTVDDVLTSLRAFGEQHRGSIIEAHFRVVESSDDSR